MTTPSKSSIKQTKTGRGLLQKLLRAESIRVGWVNLSTKERQYIRLHFFAELLPKLDAKQREELAQLAEKPLPDNLPIAKNPRRKTKIKLSVDTLNLLKEHATQRDIPQGAIVEAALDCAGTKQFRAQFRAICDEIDPVRNKPKKLSREQEKELQNAGKSQPIQEVKNWIKRYRSGNNHVSDRTEAIYLRLSAAAEGRLKILCDETGMRPPHIPHPKRSLEKLVNPRVDRRYKAARYSGRSNSVVVEAAMRLFFKIQTPDLSHAASPRLNEFVQQPLVGVQVPKTQNSDLRGMAFDAIPLGANVILDPFVVLQALTTSSESCDSTHEPCRILLESCVVKARFGSIILPDLCVISSQLLNSSNYKTTELASSLRPKAMELVRCLLDNSLTLIVPDATDLDMAAQLTDIPDLGAALRVVAGERFFSANLAIATVGSSLDSWAKYSTKVFKPDGLPVSLAPIEPQREPGRDSKTGRYIPAPNPDLANVVLWSPDIDRPTERGLFDK